VLLDVGACGADPGVDAHLLIARQHQRSPLPGKIALAQTENKQKRNKLAKVFDQSKKKDPRVKLFDKPCGM